MRLRSGLVLEFWDRKRLLSLKNKDYFKFVENFLGFLLVNDLKNNDVTTGSLITKKKKITAAIIAKESGMAAGLEEFGLLNKDLKIKFLKKDGDKVNSNDTILEIEGDANKILSRERVSLNLLQRMSGIATLANSLNGKLKNKTKIAATRKTLWGLLDKKAVSIGSGLTHRLNLNDGILIKDNHLQILNYEIEKSLNLAGNRSKYIEIEVENGEQALKAAGSIKNLIDKNNTNLFAIMFDKMPPNEIKSVIEELKKLNLYNDILFEASGNINADNLAEYSGCGADIISMGFLTNPGKSLNMSLEIK